MTESQIIIPKEALSQIALPDLYQLMEGFRVLCDNAGSQQAADVAYDLYLSTLHETMNRRPQTPVEALFKLLCALGDGDCSTGPSSAYRDAQKVLGVVA